MMTVIEKETRYQRVARQQREQAAAREASSKHDRRRPAKDRQALEMDIKGNELHGSYKGHKASVPIIPGTSLRSRAGREAAEALEEVLRNLAGKRLDPIDPLDEGDNLGESPDY